MTNKTAMQELIERLKYLSIEHDDAGLRTSIQIAEELLQKEKQQIIYAREDGLYVAYNGTASDRSKTSETYYNETCNRPNEKQTDNNTLEDKNRAGEIITKDFLTNLCPLCGNKNTVVTKGTVCDLVKEYGCSHCLSVFEFDEGDKMGGHKDRITILKDNFNSKKYINKGAIIYHHLYGFGIMNELPTFDNMSVSGISKECIDAYYFINQSKRYEVISFIEWMGSFSERNSYTPSELYGIFLSEKLKL